MIALGLESPSAGDVAAVAADARDSAGCLVGVGRSRAGARDGGDGAGEASTGEGIGATIPGDVAAGDVAAADGSGEADGATGDSISTVRGTSVSTGRAEVLTTAAPPGGVRRFATYARGRARPSLAVAFGMTEAGWRAGIGGGVRRLTGESAEASVS